MLDTIGGHGGDPARVFVAGHSAGAYNAAMLAVEASYLADVGKSPDQLCGAVSLAGPIGLNLLDYDSTRPIFQHEVNPDATRPVALIKPGAPPFLLVHGEADTTVYKINSTMVEAALRRVGSRVETEYLPGIGHYKIIAALAEPFEGLAKPLNLGNRIAAFIRDGGQCG